MRHHNNTGLEHLYITICSLSCQGGFFMPEKYPQWSGILYPENMISDWKDVIGDQLQLPYCYCVHDRDLDHDGDSRKLHLHLIVVWRGPTTLAAALRLFNRLSAPGKICCSTAEPVSDIRHMYNYLIHDTDDCRKKSKFLYSSSDRVSGNGFDIGFLEQLTSADKEQILFDIRDMIHSNHISNFALLDLACASTDRPSAYLEVLRCNSHYFQRLLDGVFQLDRAGYYAK